MLRVCIPRRRDTEAVLYERRDTHKNGIGAKRGFAQFQLAEQIAHKLPDLHQRMVPRNPSLGCDVGKQPTLIHKCAPHASLRRFVTKN
jgi:hypothetical protein